MNPDEQLLQLHMLEWCAYKIVLQIVDAQKVPINVQCEEEIFINCVNCEKQMT